MNAPAPNCPRCGGLATNPAATQCAFCGAPFGQAAPPAPHVYAAPPQQGYGAPPPQAYGAAPPQGYGPPQGYAPPGYPPSAQQGFPQQGYSAPPYPQQSYAQPYAPPAYPPQSYPQPGYPPQTYSQQGPVQPFGGNYGSYVQPQRAVSGWTIFWWVRIGIGLVFLSLFLLGSCISALSH